MKLTLTAIDPMQERAPHDGNSDQKVRSQKVIRSRFELVHPAT